MDKENVAAIATTGALAGSSYFLWRKILRPNLRLLYYDMSDMSKLMGVGKKMMDAFSAGNIIGIFERTLKLHANKIMLVFEGQSYTYADVDKISNRIANFLLSQGIKTNDVVVLVISNSPQFIWTFLALRKIGAIPSLVNHNLQGKGLIHSIFICEPCMIIIDNYETIQQNIYNVRDQLVNIPLFVVNTQAPTSQVTLKEPRWTLLDPLIKEASDEPISPDYRSSLTLYDKSCYIYTSGTTGLPKAVNVYIIKSLSGLVFSSLLANTSDDVIYMALPLYHTSGLIIGLFGAIESGATVVLKRKFSASKFWSDCCEYNVTHVPYIGEFCRYILTQPDYPYQESHKVKIFYGNGLGRDIWQKFKEKYNIPKIIELYGSTEGNCFLVNLQDKVGAIGRLSPLMNMFRPNKMYLVKYDLDTVQPLRDKNGRCIQVDKGEVGLLIGKYIPEFDLQMYKSKKDLDSPKIIRNAFEEGDKYFNTGDLIYTDNDYFAYFSDRIGDTFRWKGENVSTLEVANVLRELDFISDANVYGVKIGSSSGRAGMASLLLSNGNHLTEEQLAKIYIQCKENLPSYAVPLFLRIQTIMDLTGTFKLRKTSLKNEGFNPKIIHDPLFYIDHSSEHYTPLTEKNYLKILIGHSRL